MGREQKNLAQDDGFQLQESDADNEEIIHKKLQDFNRKYWKYIKDFSFHITYGRKIVAGIVAGSTFDTLEVDYLFVDKPYRGRGLGSRLLRTAENRAKDGGCRHVLLNTYSFQAPRFYPKMGYRQLFCIKNAIGPYSQYFFWKDLQSRKPTC